MVDDIATPRVFISYSHDSPEHKRWVLELATYLLEHGVDVIIDAWDLRPGDDVPKFMERGVRDADRVLMICTETYVNKANDGVGGVGYEAMIVTGELVRDLGTAKFVPIVRQTSITPIVPTSVSTRRYINLGESAGKDSELELLLRDLHDAPSSKPPLGRSPYPPEERPAPRGAPTGGVTAGTVELTVDDLSDPALIYERATELARSGDVQRWRRLVRAVREKIGPGLRQWWAKYAAQVPQTIEPLAEQSMEGADAFAPLIALSLGGLASGHPKFRDQVGLLEDILNPTEWQRGGFVVRTELPETGAFVYQALHGAMCMNLGDLSAAIALARTRTESRKTQEPVPLWGRTDIVGWPESLGRNADAAWNVAFDLATRWSWIDQVFGHSEDYQVALYAYYVTLSVLELAEWLHAGNVVPDASAGDLFLAIPPVFDRAPDEVKRRGYRLLTSMRAEFRDLLRNLGVDENKIRSEWPKWMSQQRKWRGSLRVALGRALPHERLIEDILET
jgi:hypothetical protein